MSSAFYSHLPSPFLHCLLHYRSLPSSLPHPSHSQYHPQPSISHTYSLPSQTMPSTSTSTAQANPPNPPIYTITVHLTAKSDPECIAKLKAKLIEASRVYSQDTETLSWLVMQDVFDKREFTIVERYERESVCHESLLEGDLCEVLLGFSITSGVVWGCLMKIWFGLTLKGGWNGCRVSNITLITLIGRRLIRTFCRCWRGRWI
jgi:hypothetical protein